MLSACGGGGGGEPPPPPPPTTQDVTGGGVKGPMANADVAAFSVDYTNTATFKSATPVATGTTDPTTAAITGLGLPLPLENLYILEFTSNPSTTDLTTGQAPVITTLRTVATQAMLTAGNVYATPQTTMAVDLAIASGATNDTEFLAALDVGASQVVSTLGFGMTSNIFTTPPLLDSTTNSVAQQTEVAAYRTAVEALTAMVFQMGNAAPTATTTDTMLAELTSDLADGLIDGNLAGGTPSTLIDTAVLAVLAQVPAALVIPNTATNVGDVEALLVTESGATGGTPTPELIGGTIIFDPQPVQTNTDTDGDGRLNADDNCPAGGFNPNETNPDQTDSDGDGIGDICDPTPIPIPNVVDQEQATATISITTAGLIVGNITATYHPTIIAGNVISTTPVAGTSVAAGSTVDLVISLGPNTVPNVIDTTQANAITTIEAAGLVAGIPTTAYHDTIIAGNVISTTPVAGTIVAAGSTVDFVVSSGPSVVPNVIDTTQASAITAIEAEGLVAGTPTFIHHDTIVAGNVINTTPIAGTTAPVGSTVNLVVSAGPSVVPDVVDTPQASAITAIEAQDLVAGTPTFINHDTIAAGNVISTTPNAGTMVPVGSTVELVVSLGPATVPTVINMTEANAIVAIEAAGLVAGTPTTAFHDTIIAGNVISTTPAAGTSVALGSNVELVVSLGPSIVPDVVNTAEASAIAAINAEGLVAGTPTTAFHDTIVAGNVITTTPIAGTTSPVGSTVNFIVSAGPSIVPSVLDTPQASAITAIEAVGLVAGTPTFINHDTIAAGNVISTTPNAGTMVPVGSTVELVVSLGPATVPTVINMTEANAIVAIVAIEAAGLVAGTPTTAFHDTIIAGSVISTTPVAGTSVALNSTVNLVVSSGPSIVPDVVNTTEASAIAAIEAVGLVAGTPTFVHHDTIAAGNVISTTPIAGTTSPVGSTVNFIVSAGPSIVPDVVNTTEASAIAAIEAVGLVAGTPTFINHDTIAAGNVISTTPNAGTTAPVGSTVNLIVSSGPVGTTIDISGVWIINSTVTDATGTGCDKGVGANGVNIVTLNQTGSTLNGHSYEGVTFTGSIDTVTGNFTVTGTNSGTKTDLTQPTIDTAFIAWDDTLDATGTGVTATSLAGSVTTIESEGGSPICTYTENYTGTFVYQHSGTEDYNGVYAIEINDAEINSNGTVDVGRGGFPVQLELVGSTINIHISNDGPAAVNDRYTFSSPFFDPNTGFFSVVLDEVERNDIDVPPNGVIDNSESRKFAISGIFMRDPAVTNGSNGVPLLVMSDHGYTHFYTGDVDAGGTPFAVQNSRAYYYGKRLVTQGLTRTSLVELGDQTYETQILVGLENPPLKRVDTTNSSLYLEVFNSSGIRLCSVPYIDAAGGRYFEQINMPHPLFNNAAFRGNAYSTVTCNTSAVGVVTNGEPLTVRVLDTGDGIKDTTGLALMGDDSLVVIPILGTDTVSYNAEVVPLVDRFTDTTKVFDIVANGASGSTTTSGDAIPLFGYFDLGKPITVIWPTLAGADRYQLRVQEGTGPDDFVKLRFGTTTTTATIPADTIGRESILRVVGIKDTVAGPIAHAYSRRVAIRPGIWGLFNIELGNNSLPLSHRTFQVYVEGNGFAICAMSSIYWQGQVNCTSAFVNSVTDTVTLNMIDVDGTYTSGAPGTPFTLLLQFTDAQTAVVTSPDITTGVSAARVANPEFVLRTRRLSHPATLTERTHINITNSFPTVFDRAVLSREDGAAFGSGGSGPATSVVLWDGVLGPTFLDVATEFTSMPTDDGDAQRTKLMATFDTGNLGFSNNVVLASGVYKLVLISKTGAAPNAVLRYNYTAPSAANYVAPAGTSITVDGTACSVSICNDPATPIGVTATPDLSWTIDPSVPAGSFWRLQFRPTDTTGDVVGERYRQVRSPFMANGDFGLSITGSTATWTNPGSLVLPPGEYEVQIYVYDNDAGFNSTVFGSSTGPGGVGGDQLYITVP